MSRLDGRLRIVLMLALLGVVVVAAPEAAISVLSRSTVLSLDNPATQILDELATQNAPHFDPLLEATRALRVAAGTSGRLSPRKHFEAQRQQRLGSIEARAPPAV